MLRSSEPDTYETPDVSVASGIVSDSRVILSRPDSLSESLDSSSLAQDSFKTFADKDINVGRQDFSFAKIGKPLNQQEYSVNPLAKNSQSPLERYNKLRFEVEALISDIAVIQQEAPEFNLEQGNKASDIAAQLTSLSQLLDQCESSISQIGQPKVAQLSGQSVSSQLIKELKAFGAKPQEAEAKSEQVTYELYSTPKSINSNEQQVVSELEKRIHNLEKQIGIDSGKASGSQKPIGPSLDIIEDKLALLDENKLALIETKLATLHENLKKKKDLLTSAENEEKIDQLFETMNKWDSNTDQIPLIVDRLTALKHVHEQSVFAVASVAQIQKDQDSVSQLIKSIGGNFDNLQHAFTENMKIIESNTTRLDQRMEELSKRIAALNK